MPCSFLNRKHRNPHLTKRHRASLGSPVRAVRLLTVMALLASLSACVSSLNYLSAGHDLKVAHDVKYGSDARQGMNVYTLRDAERHAGKGPPVVVFLYGGSWQEGNKENYAFVAAALARHGYVTFVPDYRIYPQARYPDFLDDAAHAVAYARAHAAEYGGDPSRLFLVGHSAGSYIVAMLALDPRWLGSVGLDPARDIRGAVGLAGPYDFLPLQDPTLEKIFENPAGLAVTQPINHVSGTAPPMLLIAGQNDKLVDPGNTDRLTARIREKGGQVEEIMYHRAGHRVIIGAFSRALRFLSPSFSDTTRFIDQHDAP
jgi:acetyl esterase/lipase